MNMLLFRILIFHRSIRVAAKSIPPNKIWFGKNRGNLIQRRGNLYWTYRNVWWIEVKITPPLPRSHLRETQKNCFIQSLKTYYLIVIVGKSATYVLVTKPAQCAGKRVRIYFYVEWQRCVLSIMWMNILYEFRAKWMHFDSAPIHLWM